MRFSEDSVEISGFSGLVVGLAFLPHTCYALLTAFNVVRSELQSIPAENVPEEVPDSDRIGKIRKGLEENKAFLCFPSFSLQIWVFRQEKSAVEFNAHMPNIMVSLSTPHLSLVTLQSLQSFAILPLPLKGGRRGKKMAELR